MSNMSENKIDLEDLERAVTEATGSKAVGRFTRVAFEAAMNLRAGLSREQTPICDVVPSGKWAPNVCKTAVRLEGRP